MLVRPVLVRPRHDGNVGAVVRVAANFGIAEVAVVAPGCDLEGSDFRRMAMGAERLVALRVVGTLDEAVDGTEVVVATTSGRARDPRHLLTPEEVAARLGASAVAAVAVVFGSERGGLRLDELRRSHMVMTIPADPAFPTLNLVQAVAVALAALRRGCLEPPRPADPDDLPASDADFDAVMRHLERALLASSFLERTNPARIGSQLRALVGRAVPTRRDLAIVRALAAHLEWLWQRKA